MASTVSKLICESLRQRLESVTVPQAKADLQKVAEAWKARVGGVVVRMRGLVGLSQKELAALLGHPDQSQIYKWESGKERPQFDALFAVECLRQPLVMAIAELAGEEVIHTIRFKVRA